MSEIKEIIRLYKKVQAVPYYCLIHKGLDLSLEEPKGSCLEKHLFLGNEFKKLGIPVKYLLIKFSWNDLPIPKEIIKETKSSSTDWHLALKIKPQDKWIVVDAVWDLQLEKAGFPVTRDWSGLEDTKLAVSPKKIIELKVMPLRLFSFLFKIFENRKFSKALNNWLESQRKL